MRFFLQFIHLRTWDQRNAIFTKQFYQKLTSQINDNHPNHLGMRYPNQNSINSVKLFCTNSQRTLKYYKALSCYWIFFWFVSNISECRFQAYFSHQYAHTLYPFGPWYYRSMWRSVCKYLSIVEAMHGLHLMARTENNWPQAMLSYAAWHLGLCLLLAKSTPLMTSSVVSTKVSTGICGRVNPSMDLMIHKQLVFFIYWDHRIYFMAPKSAWIWRCSKFMTDSPFRPVCSAAVKLMVIFNLYEREKCNVWFSSFSEVTGETCLLYQNAIFFF